MLRNFLIGIAVCLAATHLSAQSLKSYERAADEAMERLDYNAALQYYAAVLDRKKDDLGVWWKYGEAGRAYFALDEAEKAYQRVLAGDPDHDAYPLAPYRLAQIKKMKGQYAEATELLTAFLTNAPAAHSAAAQQELDDCTWAIEALKNDSLPQIVHLGKTINSEYSDFAPVYQNDTLFFSSYRFDVKRDASKPRKKTTRLMRALPGSRARPPGRGFPDADSVHFAHTAFYAHGVFLVFNQCKNEPSGKIRCDLWLTVQDLRGRWIKPMRLPEPINLPEYTSTQPAIGFDSLALSPVLYFASDRPGGKGGLDLWSVILDTLWFCPCNRPLDARKSSFHPSFEQAPTPVEALNTEGDDLTPFFHDKSQTLFFSSDARQGFGGYDVYGAAKKGDQWETPYNLGAGVNTSYNDLYYFLKPDGLNGIVSSNRPGSFYLDPNNKACCNDLFDVHWPQPDTLVNRDPEPEKPFIVETPPEKPEPEEPTLEEFVGLPLYFDNDEPDPRTRRTTTRKNYETTVLRYLSNQEEYRAEFSNGLPKPRKEEAEDAIDAFFDNDVRAGYERLVEFAAQLLQHLQAGEKVEVLIKGYTSPRAQSDYNLNLGSRRVSSVINFFMEYENGALRKFAQDDSLRIAETSYGEARSARGISDDIADRRNSVYHPAAARERRVEIVRVRVMEKN